jgi:hypothetical protein
MRQKKTRINNQKKEKGHAFNMQILCFGNEDRPSSGQNRATLKKYQSHSSVVVLWLRFGIQICLFWPANDKSNANQ